MSPDLTPLGPSDVFRQAAVLFRETMDDELLLYDPRGPHSLYLNATAALIFELCDGTHTMAGLTTLLAQTYPEMAARIPGEVEATLRDLLGHGVLERL